MFVRLVLARQVGLGSRPLSVLSVLGWWFLGCPVGGGLPPVLAAVEVARSVPLRLVCWNWVCRC